ncbi:MAG: metallophosphoesterase family protein [Lachnospiraceae bacterium]|nr:metallophosphoesterase family protein [Lachnospiraceae bacterium]
MKVLVISDTESPYLWDFFSKDKLGGAEVIISCGDLKAAYLEFLVTMANVPLVYVHGNHDETFETKPPEGCDCLEDRVLTVKGLRIAGLGGSMRYNDKSKYMSTEAEMEKRVKKLCRKIKRAGGLDIFVSHAPAKGYGDQEDLAHRGFSCFHDLLDEFKPSYMFFGHVHKEYGGFQREYIYNEQTKIVNGWGYYLVDVPVEEGANEASSHKFHRFFRGRGQ